MSAKLWWLICLVPYFATMLLGDQRTLSAPVIQSSFGFPVALLTVLLPWVAMLVAWTTPSGVWGLFVMSLFANTGGMDTLGHASLQTEGCLGIVSLVMAIIGHWERRGAAELETPEDEIEEDDAEEETAMAAEGSANNG